MQQRIYIRKSQQDGPERTTSRVSVGHIRKQKRHCPLIGQCLSITLRIYFTLSDAIQRTHEHLVLENSPYGKHGKYYRYKRQDNTGMHTLRDKVCL